MHMPPGSDIPSRRAANVHAVTEEIIAFDNDIAKIDAHPELDPFLDRHIRVSAIHSTLDIQATAGPGPTGRVPRFETTCGEPHSYPRRAPGSPARRFEVARRSDAQWLFRRSRR